jgi:hypothetical protein
MLLAQREAFRKKFGRDPGPSDPVFFDPDADQPTPISWVHLEAQRLEAMRKSGAPPQFVYAYQKTGLLFSSVASVDVRVASASPKRKSN